VPSSENRIIIACAGSGKTTRLVVEALANRHRRIAMVTYTNNNAREIITRFGQRNSGVPKHVDVMTWFGFLLRECARPYQRAKYTEKRIESLLFVNEQSAKYIRETDVRCHYFANGELIYSDKIAKFVIACEAKTGKAVTSRLEKIYTDVFIDEFQDLAGWDLEVIRMLLQSGIRVTLVGDPRQHIYSTNPSQKNKQYLGGKVVNLVKKWEKKGLCNPEYMNFTYRCNHAICEFVNLLWPGMEPIKTLRSDPTEHEGIFLVSEKIVKEYIERFRPQILRYDKNVNTYGQDALNFGLAKGLQFKRVLIIPTKSMKKYLQSGDLTHVEKTKDKLHVAVTRAEYSVAFVLEGHSPLILNRWEL
jgi:DNA helicase II / ATP-dependent DNA helicase PcrA